MTVDTTTFPGKNEGAGPGIRIIPWGFLFVPIWAEFRFAKPQGSPQVRGKTHTGLLCEAGVHRIFIVLIGLFNNSSY
jgi:hypothetical protein